MSRRYYLHRVLRKKRISYNPYSKTVFKNFDTEVNDRHVKMLQNEFNYSVQLEIY